MSTSSRSFKSPFKTKSGSKSDKKNQSDSQSNRNIDAPLTFSEKLDRWKRRMSASSSYGTPLKSKGAVKSSNLQKCATESKRRNSFSMRSRRFKSTSPPKAPVRKTKHSPDPMKTPYVPVEQSKAVKESHHIYDEVIEEFGKMTSAPSDEDQRTETTGTLTNPKYSFDDGSTIVSEDGHYLYHSFKSGNQIFTIDRRYSHIRTIGSGAYGVVISAKDVAGPNKVAIKMIPRAFHDEVDAKRILREIKLLKHFRHENIISILDMMPPLAKQVENFHDVYIVTDLMETDLHRIIYSKQTLSIEHVQYFVYQILRAVKYMHSANVIHRDLKPSNLLVNSNCDLKVCDFGLARGITESHDENHYQMADGDPCASMLLTEYVVTRWYRAPEIMLACHQYSKPVDIWSVGCIFAELLARKPYLPGEDYIDQLTRISSKLGKLPEEDLDFVTSEKAKRFMRRLPDKPVQTLRRQFPGTPPEAVDLLGKMLQIHPGKRISVIEALEHPFLRSLHSPEHEYVAHAPFDFSFEDEKLHRVRLQELIWQEVGDFRPTCLPVPQRYYCAQVGDSFVKKLCPS